MSRSFQFSHNGTPQTLTLPDPASNVPSVFLVGMAKAGSTLLNRVMRPLCVRSGLAPVRLHNEMRALGIPGAEMPETIGEIYAPKGYAYMGYRGLNIVDRIPGYASDRTVFLVRDPRDMVVSKYFSEAFSHRPPGSAADDRMAQKFHERRQALQDMALDAYVIEAAGVVSQSFANTHTVLSPINHRVWRYEDIIFDKQNWVQHMLSYLGLEVQQAIIDRVVERNDVRPDTEQTDAHVRKVTPGDHRNKLSDETIAQLNEIFAPVLERYGYT